MNAEQIQTEIDKLQSSLSVLLRERNYAYYEYGRCKRLMKESNSEQEYEFACDSSTLAVSIWEESTAKIKEINAKIDDLEYSLETIIERARYGL